MSEFVFFFDHEGDTRKVTCGADEFQSVEDLIPLLQNKYEEVEFDTKEVKFWTKDQTYQVRHKVEALEDVYSGAILEVTSGKEQKRKRENDKEGAAKKRPRRTGPRFILRLRGLPWSASRRQIKEFFEGMDLLELHILCLPDGRATGEALVEFYNEEDMEKGLEKDKENIGSRYVEIFKTTAEEMDRALGYGDSNTIKDPDNKVLRMRGLPYTATEKDILQFFEEGSVVPAKIHIVADKSTGRSMGVALVEFETDEEILAALDLNRNEIGDRWIELFRSSMDELRGAIGQDKGSNRGGMGWQGEAGGRPGDNCIRMRGMPFNSSDRDISTFFEQAGAKPLRIHRKEDGSEAFVEFHEGDVSKAMTKQKSYMGHRYVELFRVSYDEVAQIVGLPPRGGFHRGGGYNKGGFPPRGGGYNRGGFPPRGGGMPFRPPFRGGPF